MSLLTLVQAVCKEVGVNAPASAYSSTDPQVIQIVALAQEEGTELMRRHDWPRLMKEKTFTGTAAAVQTGALASDFDRFIDETFYNRTKKRPVFGPLSPTDWQFAQAMVAATIVESFRVRGSDILLTPTPTTDTYAYEYISNLWCETSGATGQSAWGADSDVGRLSENLMKLGTIWRFLRAKEFDYDEPFRTYELQVAQEYGRAGGRRTISMGSSRPSTLRKPFIPEGGWSL